MKYSGELLKTPARRVFEICWNKCLPKYRYKYLQGTEILDLIKELEKFLGVRELLKPDEESLLRTTLKLKPQLRLFKGECLSFLLGLVHFSTVEEFLETRFRISSARLRELIELNSNGYLENHAQPNIYDPAASNWRERSKTTGIYGTYGTDLPDFSKDRKDFSSYTKPDNSCSWYLKWKSSIDSAGDKKLDFESSRLRNKNEQTLVSKWLESAKNLVLGYLSSAVQEPSPLHHNPISSRQDPMDTYPISRSVKLESSAYDGKFDTVKESLADVRLQTQKLENDAFLSSGKSMNESLDQLQAAVRDQARIISRLERERGNSFKTRGPGLLSLIYTPWNYFTGFVTTFIRDLVDELLPEDRRWVALDFLVRVISLILGYFVIMNFFRLVYFLAVLIMYSSETALPYVFSNEDGRESAPLSWLQEFPALEYWAYVLREWTGY